MATHIENDLGEMVVAEGAEGSIARVKLQYPKLINEIAGRISNVELILDIERDLTKRGFTSKLERDSLIFAASEQVFPQAISACIMHHVGECKKSFKADDFTQWDETQFVRAFRRIYLLIQLMNMAELVSWLGYQNKNYRAFFTAITQIELGSTDKSMKAALKKWAESK